MTASNVEPNFSVVHLYRSGKPWWASAWFELDTPATESHLRTLGSNLSRSFKALTVGGFASNLIVQ